MPKELFDKEFKETIDRQVSTYGVSAIQEILLTIQNTCNANKCLAEEIKHNLAARTFATIEAEYYKVLSNLMQITLNGLFKVEKATKEF